MKKPVFTPLQTPDVRRRTLVIAGGSMLLCTRYALAVDAAEIVDISMAGTATGSQVWFRPRGLLIRPGTTVRWTNDDAANVHTVTAYHADNGKPRRMPADADSWNSGYLMPGESFSLTFDVPGVYDYFCIPHEQAGMVGRIVVKGNGAGQSDHPYAHTDTDLPEQALANFPAVNEIIKKGSLDQAI